jgi:hypothetical protein
MNYEKSYGYSSFLFQIVLSITDDNRDIRNSCWKKLETVFSKKNNITDHLTRYVIFRKLPMGIIHTMTFREYLNSFISFLIKKKPWTEQLAFGALT